MKHYVDLDSEQEETVGYGALLMIPLRCIGPWAVPGGCMEVRSDAEWIGTFTIQSVVSPWLRPREFGFRG